MISPDATVRRARLTACRYVAEAAIIMVVREKRLYRIAGVGMFICRLAESPVTVRELASRVTAEYDVPADRAAADVSAFVRDLADKGILAVTGSAGAQHE